IPRLDLASSTDLLGPLHALGLKDKPLRGFGAMPLRIAKIAQRTVFKLDEQGAQAAAATSVLLDSLRSADRPIPVQLVLDKPFLFALRDRTTGFILLAGYVGRPNPAA